MLSRTEPFDVLTSSPAPSHFVPASVAVIDPLLVSAVTSPPTSMRLMLPLLVRSFMRPRTSDTDRDPFDDPRSMLADCGVWIRKPTHQLSRPEVRGPVARIRPDVV